MLQRCILYKFHLSDFYSHHLRTNCKTFAIRNLRNFHDTWNGQMCSRSAWPEKNRQMSIICWLVRCGKIADWKLTKLSKLCFQVFPIPLQVSDVLEVSEHWFCFLIHFKSISSKYSTCCRRRHSKQPCILELANE